MSSHPTRDFTPVTLAIRFPFVLSSPPSLPATNVQELIALGTEPWPTQPEEMRAWITQEHARWSKIIHHAGIKPD